MLSIHIFNRIFIGCLCRIRTIVLKRNLNILKEFQLFAPYTAQSNKCERFIRSLAQCWRCNYSSDLKELSRLSIFHKVITRGLHWSPPPHPTLFQGKLTQINRTSWLFYKSWIYIQCILEWPTYLYFTADKVYNWYSIFTTTKYVKFYVNSPPNKVRAHLAEVQGWVIPLIYFSSCRN